jgi:hypothetical protein
LTLYGGPNGTEEGEANVKERIRDNARSLRRS